MSEELKSSDLIKFDETGLHIATKEKIKEYLKQAISQAYGDDINFNPSYPDGIFVEALAVGFRDVFETIQGMYNSFNLRNSSGAMLDMLSSLINVHRKVRTSALLTLNMKLTGPEITYNPGEIILKDKNNLLWKNKEEIIYQGTETEKAIIFECEKKEEVELPATSDFTILSPQTSNISIKTKLKFIQGKKDEDDISLRNRIMTTPIHNSVSIKDNLLRMLLEHEYVKDAKIYTNDLDTNLSLNIKDKGGSKFLELPPTQMAIIIQYNEELMPDSSKEEELKIIKDSIAEIIAEYKGLGTISYDSKTNDLPTTTVEYTPSADSEYKSSKVYYIEAQKKKGINIGVKIFKGTNYNQGTTESFIKRKVCEYLETLKIGEKLVSGKLIGYLYSNSDNQFGVTSITLSSGSEESYDEYFPLVSDYFTDEGSEITNNEYLTITVNE